MLINDIHNVNEWYPRGIQIGLHRRSPGLQAYGGEGGIPE